MDGSLILIFLLGAHFLNKKIIQIKINKWRNVLFADGFNITKKMKRLKINFRFYFNKPESTYVAFAVTPFINFQYYRIPHVETDMAISIEFLFWYMQVEVTISE
jgi:hypothetical protein